MMNRLFFELIRVAIGKSTNLSYTPSTEEWEHIYQMAAKQALLGVCFYGLQRLGTQETISNLPIALKMKWFTITLKIQKQNKKLNERCVELQNRMRSDGFRSYIMKGQGNAALYVGSIDESEQLCMYRQSGDIDIFLEGGFNRVIDYVTRTHPTKDINNLEIHYNCYNDVDVEIHYKPFLMRNPWKNALLQRFFKEEEEKCFANSIVLPTSGVISVPTLKFNLVHQMVHIFHHLCTEGIGLRQLMDYYFLVLRVYYQSEDIGKALMIIHNLGLDRFASAIMWVMQEVFGLEEEKMLWQPNKKDGSFILKDIMQRGNFGHFADDNASLNSYWDSFWYVNSRTIKFWRFDYWAWFWTPFWRLYFFCWRKLKGYN